MQSLFRAYDSLRSGACDDVATALAFGISYNMQRVAEFHAKMAVLCGWFQAALIDETSPCPEIIMLSNTAKYGHTALVLNIKNTVGDDIQAEVPHSVEAAAESNLSMIRYAIRMEDR